MDRTGNWHLAASSTRASRDLDRLDPGRAACAVEEMLRYDGPVGFATLRYASEPQAQPSDWQPGFRIRGPRSLQVSLRGERLVTKE